MNKCTISLFSNEFERNNQVSSIFKLENVTNISKIMANFLEKSKFFDNLAM